MNADDVGQIFGQIGQRDVEVHLPLTLRLRRSYLQGLLSSWYRAKGFQAHEECIITIETDGPPTSTTWYKIWEAITAVSAKCVRKAGRGGRIRGLGKSYFNKNPRQDLYVV